MNRLAPAVRSNGPTSSFVLVDLGEPDPPEDEDDDKDDTVEIERRVYGDPVGSGP